MGEPGHFGLRRQGECRRIAYTAVDARGRLPESGRSKNQGAWAPLTTRIRRAPPGRAFSFFPPIFVLATRLNQRGSARRLLRISRTRADRRNPCSSRPDWAGLEEAADDRRREVETWSGITRCKNGRRGKRRPGGCVLAASMTRASRPVGPL